MLSNPQGSMSHDAHPILEVTAVAQGGDGVARDPSGRVVFIPRALPGERVRARYTRQKRSYARAVIDEIERPAPERQPPGCPHYERCGACDFWHTSYEVAWSLKAQAAQDTVGRVGKLSELPEPARFASPQPRGYRTRATARLVRTRRGTLIGFLERGDHRVVAIPECQVLDPALLKALQACRDKLTVPRRAEIFVETSGRGGAIVTLRNPQVSREDRVRLLAELAGLATHDDIDGVCFEAHRYGEPEVELAEAFATPPKASVRVPAGLFRQAHRELNRELVGWVRERVQALGARSALELYAGAGNFSFALAGEVEKLTCVEGSEEATEVGAQIARSAGLTHVTFEARDLEVEVHGMLDDAPDVVVLDPPREGARAVCEVLADEGPRAVVYVSCDPACLGRDLAILAQGGYSVTSWALFDMFPWTSHVEVAVCLERG